MYDEELNKNKLLDKYKEVGIDKFKKQLYELENFIKDPQWLGTLKFDITINPFLAQEITDLIKEISKETIKEETLIYIRKKCISIMEIADNCENFILKWFLYRKAYAYYGLNECIIEGSTITDDILEEFKKIYQDGYLKVLKELDNENPSVLTQFKKSETNVEESELTRLYLLMKKWQDDQHIFHKEALFPKFKKTREIFEDQISKYKYLENSMKRNKIALVILDNMGVIPIEILSRYIIGGISQDLSCVVGGKNLGLAILNSYGLQIPQNTFAISVKSLNDGKYEKQLCNLPNCRWAVRSSATVEDNMNQSFAGMFKSVLNVKKNELVDAIKDVKNSISSKRVRAYIEKFNTNEPYMSVVLQKFDEPEISGVWIGTDKEKGHLEWVEGNGEKLVSGKIKPYYEDWTKQNNDGKLKVDKNYVGDLCKKNQKKLNKVADFEWCILNSKIVWLQFRPVTKIIEYTEGENDNNGIVGVPASLGIVEGVPRYLEDVEELHEFKTGEILLTDFTDPEWVPAMVKAKAIVTAEGGFLSHSAIISRELGIPCVTGIGYANLENLAKCKKIEVDGNTGKISKKD